MYFDDSEMVKLCFSASQVSGQITYLIARL